MGLDTTLDFAKLVIIVPVMVMAVNTATRLRRLLFIQAASVATISAVAVWKEYAGRPANRSSQGQLLQFQRLGTCDRYLTAAVSCFIVPEQECFFEDRLGGRDVSDGLRCVSDRIEGLPRSRSYHHSLSLGICHSRTPNLSFSDHGLASQLALCLSSNRMLSDRLKSTFDSENDVASAYGSAEQRQHLFWQSLAVTLEHPLFGVGPGSFSDYL